MILCVLRRRRATAFNPDDGHDTLYLREIHYHRDRGTHQSAHVNPDQYCVDWSLPMSGVLSPRGLVVLRLRSVPSRREQSR